MLDALFVVTGRVKSSNPLEVSPLLPRCLAGASAFIGGIDFAGAIGGRPVLLLPIVPLAGKEMDEIAAERYISVGAAGAVVLG